MPTPDVLAAPNDRSPEQPDATPAVVTNLRRFSFIVAIIASVMAERPKQSQGTTRRAFLGGAAMSGVPKLFAGRSDSREYRLIRAEGTHRELGRRHGEQAAEQIRAHVDYIA